ncbi:hypothetical protein ACP70R_014751 [Stipagrostis hirtigluma subsp. patula]
MAAPLLLLLVRASGLLLLAVDAVARVVPVEYLYLPFNLTYLHLIDPKGVILLSLNANFSAAVYGAGAIDSEDAQSR